MQPKVLALFALFTLFFAVISAKNYDYIVIGGGTSGAVVAALLSANPNNKLLLVEEGDDDSNLFSHVVGFYGAAIAGAGFDINKLYTENHYVEKDVSSEYTLSLRSMPALHRQQRIAVSAHISDATNQHRASARRWPGRFCRAG